MILLGYKNFFCLSSVSLLIMSSIDPIALRKAKIVNNFGLSECNKVKEPFAYL